MSNCKTPLPWARPPTQRPDQAIVTWGCEILLHTRQPVRGSAIQPGCGAWAACGARAGCGAWQASKTKSIETASPKKSRIAPPPVRLLVEVRAPPVWQQAVALCDLGGGQGLGTAAKSALAVCASSAICAFSAS